MVQGSIVVAVGSSVPELASVVLTALAGAFEMGVGAIVGSAIFNVLVIPAVAGILTEDPLDVNRTVVYKEAQFYMLAVSVLLITFALGVIYYPVDGDQLVGAVTRPLALIPVGLYGLYVFIQWQDVGDHDADDAGGDIVVAREWAKLAAGLLFILVAVESLVGAIEGLNATFGIPDFFAGVTVLAAARSRRCTPPTTWQTSTTTRTSAIRPRSRSLGASTQRCTGDGCGRCGSTPGWARPAKPTSGSTT